MRSTRTWYIFSTPWPKFLWCCWFKPWYQLKWWKYLSLHLRWAIGSFLGNSAFTFTSFACANSHPEGIGAHNVTLVTTETTETNAFALSTNILAEENCGSYNNLMINTELGSKGSKNLIRNPEQSSSRSVKMSTTSANSEQSPVHNISTK